MTNPPDREVAIFGAALRLPTGERKAYLDEACAGDAALRQRIEELLEASDEAGNFLASPAEIPAGGTVRIQPISIEKPGDRIGRYKLLQQIGEGGCGVVYMAEQEEPVRRQVALKVIRLGMDTKSVIARFEAERQALALMDHPNIAKVLDAGATDTGRPYFVMELVRGIKITDYCDQKNLSTRERLDLFIQVCRAIQHAHQKGVIHRDIKPSNILVTMDDGVALPKVIDFGIAKATRGKLTDQTLFTAFEQFIGTPAYMSPEQAELSAQDIDTRSDIYSLGVLLYELLTGQTPFDAKKLLQAGLDEIRRTIREQEPARPSTCLSTLAGVELTAVAKLRNAEPPKLVHLVRGDLDWIVMKALEKDRARRYETANGLAADIQRHLCNEPVLANPPSAAYRFRKMVQRNQLAFAAASAVAAALFIGLGFSTSMFFKEKEARQQAQANEEKAKTEAAKSQQVAQFLEAMLQGVGPSRALGRDTTMLQEILDQTAQRVGLDLTNEPVVETELQTTIGEVYLLLGEFAKAEAVERRALEIRRRLWGEEHPAVAESLHNLARILTNEGQRAQAESLHRQALALRRKLLVKDNPAVAESLQDLALALQVSKPVEAESLLREALAIDRKAWGEGDVRLIVPLRNLALVLDITKLDEAESLSHQAVDLARGIPGGPRPDLAESLRIQAQVLVDDKGKVDAAEQAAREAVAINQKLMGNRNPTVADSLNELAWVLYKRGKWAEAETSALGALSIHRQLQPNGPDDGFALNTLGLLYERSGRWQEAAADFGKLAELEPGNDFIRFVLAALSVELGDLAGYRTQCEKMVAAFGGSSDPAALDKTAKACLLIPGGGCDLNAAGQMADRAIALGKDNQYIRFFEFAKGLAEYRRRQFASATDWLDKVIEADKASPAWNCELAAYSVLAMAQQQLHQPDEARAALALGEEISRTKLPQLESGDLGDDSQDWLIAHILLREAKTVVGPQ